MIPLKNVDVMLNHCISSEEIAIGLSLRYQVYVDELGFEDGYGGIETDKYDAEAQHFVFRDANTLEPIGYFRLLGAPSSYVVDAPFFDHNNSPNVTQIKPEISRLLILKEYRNGEVIKQVAKEINAALLYRNHSMVYAVMEKALGVSLRRLKYEANRVSDDFDCQGLRSVYLLKVA